MALTVTTHEVDGVSILTLDGPMVFGEDISAVRQTVKRLIGNGKRKIVLNMEHVVKIDSFGLGVLVSVHNTAITTGTSLRLCNAERKVKEALQITKLIDVFQFSDNEAEAVRAEIMSWL